MKAKYIRVSTQEQNTARQEQTTTDVKHYIDKISGAIPFNQRPQAKKLIKDIEAGKITEVEIHSIDRLGRNQIDILNTIELFKANKTQLTIESLGLKMFTPSGKESSAFGLIISVMSSMAQMEREQIKERQLEGIAIAKAKGIYQGRKHGSVDDDKKTLEKHSDVVKCLSKKMSIRETASITKKSTATVQKVAKILKG